MRRVLLGSVSIVVVVVCSIVIVLLFYEVLATMVIDEVMYIAQ